MDFPLHVGFRDGCQGGVASLGEGAAEDHRKIRQEWADDPRKDDSRVTSRRVENGNLMFKDKKDYDEWFQEQKQKDLLADALREGDGSSRNQINILPRKKRNGVNHA